MEITLKINENNLRYLKRTLEKDEIKDELEYTLNQSIKQKMINDIRNGSNLFIKTLIDIKNGQKANIFKLEMLYYKDSKYFYERDSKHIKEIPKKDFEYMLAESLITQWLEGVNNG